MLVVTGAVVTMTDVPLVFSAGTVAVMVVKVGRRPRCLTPELSKDEPVAWIEVEGLDSTLGSMTGRAEESAAVPRMLRVRHGVRIFGFRLVFWLVV